MWKIDLDKSSGVYLAQTLQEAWVSVKALLLLAETKLKHRLADLFPSQHKVKKSFGGV